MRKFCLIVIAVAVAVAAAGCGSSGHSASTSTSAKSERGADESAARFVVRVQAQLKVGRFAQAWRTLHPAEKRVVSVSRLASCYPKALVPGTTDSVDAKEVTLTATSTGQPKQTFTQHLVRNGSGWAWMLSPHYFAAAKRGAC